MDHENLPVTGEMSPMEAAEWGRALDAVLEHRDDAEAVSGRAAQGAISAARSRDAE